MNFDIKDVKTWATRNDVKVGDEGYFVDFFSNFKRNDRIYKGTISEIEDDVGQCFHSECGYKWFFFLPLSAVKEDKPKKKKYRSFNKIKDFRDCGVIKGDCLIDTVLTLRDKKHYNLTRDMKIIDVKYDFQTVTEINGFTLDGLFRHFDIYINDEWQPFGVEVEEDE